MNTNVDYSGCHFMGLLVPCSKCIYWDGVTCLKIINKEKTDANM